jgi:hypothetical protein
MFLAWISALVRAAVIKGFRDAIDDLNLDASEAPDALEDLQQRMKALPSPKGKGKKEAA